MKSKSSAYALKRVYAPASVDDGKRVLVDRLWPRGISKDKVAIDLWLKEVAPSDALRRKVHGNPDAWPEFVAAYHRELTKEPASSALRSLQDLASSGTVTLLYASRNEERNNAVALKSWLDKSS